MAMGTVIVLLFCGYSLGISYDAKLILEKGYTCTGAQVMNVIFVVLIGLLNYLLVPEAETLLLHSPELQVRHLQA
ncbi:hypothetical protein OsI_02072 [Oryza sativa Indica Group]|uniref:Uncharacterized protein n=1 Tax=Oryza sativa subsp. indica TaxID=39946 RepID=B8A8K8_ORYSI|nr:hypothetical protein OsI_02072 [Oryza sativa Indica Group]